jgi:hypothetical protein
MPVLTSLPPPSKPSHPGAGWRGALARRLVADPDAAARAAVGPHAVHAERPGTNHHVSSWGRQPGERRVELRAGQTLEEVDLVVARDDRSIPGVVLERETGHPALPGLTAAPNPAQPSRRESGVGSRESGATKGELSFRARSRDWARRRKSRAVQRGPVLRCEPAESGRAARGRACRTTRREGRRRNRPHRPACQQRTCAESGPLSSTEVSAISSGSASPTCDWRPCRGLKP